MMHQALTPAKLCYQRLIAALAVALICCTGCGSETPPMAPVKGKVLLDGQPLMSGRVSTVPAAGRGSNGTIQSDGTFELSTYGDGDGALIGLHTVSVVARAPGTGGPEGQRGKLLVPERYTSDLSSELTIEVKADEENAPVLELTRP
ncbi:MAG: carboxypeptidase regulatory-like domain-containing protein [Pirellulales bacterium]|nr:carboxypeptidase regulatory-like domain-containing protein [Pirellulales bacterium]